MDELIPWFTQEELTEAKQSWEKCRDIIIKVIDGKLLHDHLQLSPDEVDFHYDAVISDSLNNWKPKGIQKQHYYIIFKSNLFALGFTLGIQGLGNKISVYINVKKDGKQAGGTNIECPMNDVYNIVMTAYNLINEAGGRDSFDNDGGNDFTPYDNAPSGNSRQLVHSSWLSKIIK